MGEEVVDDGRIKKKSSPLKRGVRGVFKNIFLFLIVAFFVFVSCAEATDTSLVGQWHMDNNWEDSSGNGNNGTAYNGVTFSASAKVGTHSGSFDGVNDYVQGTNKYISTAPNTFTI
ncbi:MAG: hypothetical protein HY754_05405, partial [Nitrospirae bacterium]|nr:hypothetical protein [Nitrospirota bacterium]